MSFRTDAATRAVVNELLRLRDAKVWQRSAVSWPFGEGCRFAVVLSPGNPPVGGVALPTVMPRVSELLRFIGVPQPGDALPDGSTIDSVDWNHVPTIFLPFGALTGEAQVRLETNLHLDPKALSRAVDFILFAEKKTREIAGTISDALDFARDRMPFTQSPPFVVPAGYYALGRIADAERFMAQCEAHFEKDEAMSDLYSKFAARLREAGARDPT